ncbi:hypothetical protein O181_080873 [Austropuccinia psidii MF-1]|uniref:J domain-containing protein n=1 Tax=Austropuccinia psidii MF-1 TaxID=1389203 RepID=A0A9Q3FJH1_9BASI|nr:hypothetical protein [Austropuccinia psidii MF-1]
MPFNQEALIHHPDRNISNDSTKKFQLLAEAYDTLKDPIKRKSYDRKLLKYHLKTSNSSNLKPTPSRSKSDSEKYPSSNSNNLFGYPGQPPVHIPPFNRTLSSNHSSFYNSHSTSQSSNQQHQKPFFQKLNLKDLNSINLFSHFTHPKNSSSSTSSRTSSSDLPSTHSSSKLASIDPYSTFEQAWGKSLDEIVAEVVDITLAKKLDKASTSNHTSPLNHSNASFDRNQNKKLNRSSSTNVRSLNNSPTVSVQRSATTPNASFHHQPSRSPASSFIHQRRPHSETDNRPLRRSSLQTDHQAYKEFCLPEAYIPLSSKKTSPVHSDGLYHEPIKDRLCQDSPTRLPSSSQNQFSSLSTTPTTSPDEYTPPGFNLNQVHQTHRNPLYSRNDECPSRMRRQSASSEAFSKQFQEVVIRFERERNGLTKISRDYKARTIDLDGTVHDRYRRQRASLLK